MAEAFRLIDNTTVKGGYLQILDASGRRVADFFPFASKADESEVRHYADLILRLLNEDAGRAALNQGDPQ